MWHTTGIANGHGEGDADDVQRWVATIDAAISWWGSYYDWRYHLDCTVHFQQWPTLGTRYKCKIGQPGVRQKDGGYMDDIVTSDVPSFSSFFIFTSLDLSPVQMVSAWVFTTSRNMSSGDGVSLYAIYTKSLPWAVMVSCGTYGFICLCTWNESLIVSFPSLLLYINMQPWGCAVEEGDKVTTWLHMTCPVLGNIRFT